MTRLDGPVCKCWSPTTQCRYLAITVSAHYYLACIKTDRIITVQTDHKDVDTPDWCPFVDRRKP